MPTPQTPSCPAWRKTYRGFGSVPPALRGEPPTQQGDAVSPQVYSQQRRRARAGVPQSLASRPPPHFAPCLGPSCPRRGPCLTQPGGFASEDTCAWSMRGDGADVAREMLAGASSDGWAPGAEEAPPTRPPGMERGWDEVGEKRCLLHGSDTHKMAVVGGPGCFRREGVGRWSRGGWGGGRAWGSALSWKQEMGEGHEEHKLPAAARGRRRPSERLAEGRRGRGRKGGSKRGQDKQPQRRPGCGTHT